LGSLVSLTWFFVLRNRKSPQLLVWLTQKQTKKTDLNLFAANQNAGLKIILFLVKLAQ